VYIIYFDEVKPRPNRQRYYRIGALAIPINIVFEVESKVNNLSASIFNNPKLSKNTEFHGHEIITGNKHFNDFDENKRINIYQELLAIIHNNPDILKVEICICNNHFEKTYKGQFTIGEMAFIFLVEKTNALMREQSSKGLLIGDFDEPIIDSSVTQLSEYKLKGTPYLSHEINHLIDTVHYTKSHHSRFIQLADIYVHSLQLRNNDQMEGSIGHRLKKYLDTNYTKLPDKYRQWPLTKSS
jgi:hypothetical protein